MKILTHRYYVAYSPTYNEKKNYKIIKNPFGKFAADPFLFDFNGTMYIFAEIYSYLSRKGSIGFCRYDKKTNTFGKWNIIITEKYHLSYPFIFVKNNEIYLLPESSKNHSINMYRAVDFPYKWERCEELYKGNGKFVDTTLFCLRDNTYGFTYCTESNEYIKNGELRLFKCINGKALLNEAKLITNDKSVARCAGKIIVENNRHIRVSQDCEQTYGHGLVFSEFHIDDGFNYHEEVIECIYPENVNINKKGKIIKLHTYNTLGNFTVIDIGVYEFSLSLLIIRILSGVLTRISKDKAQ